MDLAARARLLRARGRRGRAGARRSRRRRRWRRCRPARARWPTSRSTALLQLVAQGTDDLKAVTSPNKSLPFLIAGQGRDRRRSADLAGRSFGVGRIGSLDHSPQHQGAAPARASTSDDARVRRPSASRNVRAQALAAGQIDATTMSIGVWMSIPDRTGLHVLVAQDAYYAAAPVVNKVNVVTADVLDGAARRGGRGGPRAGQDLARLRRRPGAWVDGDGARAARRSTRRDLRTLAAQLRRQLERQRRAEPRRAAGHRRTGSTQTEDFAGVAPVALDEWVDFSVVDDVLPSSASRPDARPARPMTATHRRRPDAPRTSAARRSRHRCSTRSSKAFRRPARGAAVAGARRHLARGRPRQLRRPARAVRLRQDHAAAADRRPARARRRRGAGVGAPPRPGPDMGFVFQSFRLIPWATVQDNVEFAPAEASACPAPSGASAPTRYLELVGPDALRRRLSERAVGRHEAAGRAGAGAGHRAAHPADGRALRQHRRPDPRADADRADAHLGRSAARWWSSSPTASTRRSCSPTASC